MANPARIADIARISSRLHLAEVVCLVDGSQARKHAADPLVSDVWQAQIMTADRVLINRLEPDSRQALEKWLRRFNACAEIAYMKRDDVLPPSAPEPRTTTRSQARTASLRGIPEKPWHSFSVTGSAQIDRQQFAALIDCYADVLFRAKGFVIDDAQGAMLLQYSGSHLRWQTVLRPSAENRLVFIGVAGERLDKFRRAIESLL